jgi:hypothetical protein
MRSGDEREKPSNNGFVRTVGATVGVFIIMGILVTGIIFMVQDDHEDHIH